MVVEDDREDGRETLGKKERWRKEKTTEEAIECPKADGVVIYAGTLQMNLHPSPRINPISSTPSTPNPTTLSCYYLPVSFII